MEEAILTRIYLARTYLINTDNDFRFRQSVLISTEIASSPGILGRSVPGYSALLFQDGGRRSIKTKVTAPPTVPTKRAEELTGDEAKLKAMFVAKLKYALSI